jgi:hypothetical protein
VHEDVLALAFHADEAESLRVVEPLHCSCCHMLYTFLSIGAVLPHSSLSSSSMRGLTATVASARVK